MSRAVDQWWEALTGDPVAWLLDRSAPHVAWRTLVELVGRPQDSPAVRRARSGASAAEPVATLLAPLAPDGTWALEAGPWETGGGGWRLVAAVELGADPEDPRLSAAVERLLETRELPPGWDADEGVGGACAAARLLAAAAALGWAGHPTARELAARLEELPWGRPGRGSSGGGCAAAVAVAVLVAGARAPQELRPGLRRRAARELEGAWSPSAAVPGHPNLCRTDPVEEVWAAALAGLPPLPGLRPRLVWVQGAAGVGGRWPAAAEPPPELGRLAAPAWAETAARFVTLHAVVALSRYAVTLGLERRFPRPPA